MLRHRVRQIQILKSRISERLVILPQELRFYEVALVLKGGIVGIDLAFGFHDDGLMDLAVSALEDQEVRRVHADIQPPAATLLESQSDPPERPAYAAFLHHRQPPVRLSAFRR